MRIRFAVAALLLVAGCRDAPSSPPPGPSSAAPVSAAPASAAPALSAPPNGIEALEPAAILDRARQSLRKAPSFRFSSGTDGPGGRTVDLRIAGTAAQGTVVLGDERTEWLLVDGRRYLKADERFWTTRFGEQEATIGREIVGDRWMLVPPALDSRAIGKDFTVGRLLDATFQPKGTLRKESTPGAVTLSGGGAVVSVATTGEPYPLAWSDGAGTGRITEFGVPSPAITAPAEDDVFDLITLVESGMLTEL